MSFKPGDFFLGIVGFLGVLLPGAICLFLLQRHLLKTVLWQNWTEFAVEAYVLGQLLLAGTAILNNSVDYLPRLFWESFRWKIVEVEAEFRREHPELTSPAEWTAEMEAQFPREDPDTKSAAPQNSKAGKWSDRGSCFHTALSYLRLRNAAAVSEIDRHMADYKLLRSLVAVLLLIALVSFIRPVQPLWRCEGWAELVLALLAYGCFARMYDWARFFTFDYARLLKDVPLVNEK